MTATTPGLVCAHHHLYSALARGMPPPPRTPDDFTSILELVWWRLDRALDLEMLHWSAMLGALEALECGLHGDRRSPRVTERHRGSLSRASPTPAPRSVCASSCAYGAHRPSR
ncbi:MAG: hypothetical protein WKF58_11890 [Ilumatobacteraceae bacterium]